MMQEIDIRQGCGNKVESNSVCYGYDSMHS